jgi:predicted dehydrogenase
MFDFANWLCGTATRVYGVALPGHPALRTVESSSVTISYENGSTATVHYSGEGASGMPKERVEVFSAGRSWVLDDFLSLTSYVGSDKRAQSGRSADKGHAQLMAHVLGACRGERRFVPGIEAAYTAQSISLAALESIATGVTVDLVAPPAKRTKMEA